MGRSQSEVNDTISRPVELANPKARSGGIATIDVAYAGACTQPQIRALAIPIAER
jgi:hypothetical protein